jgi:hypothetical protein
MKLLMQHFVQSSSRHWNHTRVPALPASASARFVATNAVSHTQVFDKVNAAASGAGLTS